jgi:hypothetical protein
MKHPYYIFPHFAQTVSQLPKAVIASDRRERGNLNLPSKGEIASVTLFLRNDTKNELQHSLVNGGTRGIFL